MDQISPKKVDQISSKFTLMALFIAPFVVFAIMYCLFPNYTIPLINAFRYHSTADLLPLIVIGFAITCPLHCLGCWLISKTRRRVVQAALILFFSAPLLLLLLLAPSLVGLSTVTGPIITPTK